jgi:hypothetical protein
MGSDADLFAAVARREMTPEQAAEEMGRRDRRRPSLFGLAMAASPAVLAVCVLAGVVDPLSPRVLSFALLMLTAIDWIRDATNRIGGRR